MRTLEGGYGIIFDNKEEEQEFHKQVKRKADELICLTRIMILTGKHDNSSKDKIEKRD
jgi:hypothetical protein